MLLAAAAVWSLTGANGGWTRTNIAKELPDPVTGLKGVAYEKGFVPGVDFLAAMVVVAGALAGTSLFLRDKKC